MFLRSARGDTPITAPSPRVEEGLGHGSTIVYNWWFLLPHHCPRSRSGVGPGTRLHDSTHLMVSAAPSLPQVQEWSRTWDTAPPEWQAAPGTIKDVFLFIPISRFRLKSLKSARLSCRIKLSTLSTNSAFYSGTALISAIEFLFRTRIVLSENSTRATYYWKIKNWLHFTVPVFGINDGKNERIENLDKTKAPTGSGQREKIENIIITVTM